MFITKFDMEKLIQFIKLGKPHLAGSLFFYFSMGALNLPFFIFAIPMLFLQMLFANSVEIPDIEGDKIGR